MRHPLRLIASLLIVAGCAASSGHEGDASSSGGAGGDGSLFPPGTCPAGAITCSGSTAQVCDGKGGTTNDEDCSAEGKQCAPGYGCVTCIPYSNVSCQDGIATICDATGTIQVQVACDPQQGMTCAPDGCHGACAPAELGPSYIGCDYWPTITWNGVLSSWFHFAATVANASSSPANVIVTRGDQMVASKTVAPGTLEAIDLPWIPDLKGQDSGSGVLISLPMASVRANDSAYRLRSDQPVTVVQFNALEYQNESAPVHPSCSSDKTCCPDPNQAGGCFSYSNDASLLLPASSFGADYVVTDYREVTSGLSGMYDFIAITAAEDDTQVAVRANTNTRGGNGFMGVAPGQTMQFSLGKGDIVELLCGGTSLSGSRVWSPNGKKFQLLSGMPAAEIPDGVHAADHIEEVVLPLAAFGKDYLVTAPTTPLGKRIHTVRIQPAQDGTSFTFDPPAVHAAVKADAWETIEIVSVEDDFRVQADAPFGVSQYMHGEGLGPQQEGAAGAGDPSQSIAIPTAQYRSSYIFLAPADYDQNYVNITAPAGSTITLDGTAVPAEEFNAISKSGFAVARHQLPPTGAHEIHADVPFGIMVYGYGLFTSYMMPGGLDVKSISNVPPPK